MNSEELLKAQRQLRSSLLDTGRAVMPGSSDLAAHLLLYLDDADSCWRLILQWIRRTMDADRVDGGFATPGVVYRPLGESVRGDVQAPTTVGMAFDPSEPAVRMVWNAGHAVLFEDVRHDQRFAPKTREQLIAVGTRAKLAMAFREGGRPIGLMCCNWADEPRSWKSDLCRQVSDLSSQVLSPILTVTSRFSDESKPDGQAAPHAPAGTGASGGLLAELTPGELEVARLAATGMSYKEIAARLNRSFSTVDHRLRAIREKSGARSTARMISMLSELLSSQQG